MPEDDKLPVDITVLDESDTRPIELELFSNNDLLPKGYTHGFKLFNLVPWYEPNKKDLVIRPIDGATPFNAIQRTRNTAHQDYDIQVQVTAAALDGYHRFPGTREESVLDALLHICASTANGRMIEQASYVHTYVNFTLGGLYKQLVDLNGGRVRYSIAQIREALHTLRRADYTIKITGPDGRRITYDDSIIGLKIADREEWVGLEEKNTTCTARLHPIIGQAIQSLAVRPYDLVSNMQFNSPVAKGLHKVLSMRFRQARVDRYYNTSLVNTLAQLGYQQVHDSSVRFSKLVELFERGVDELIARDCLEKYEIANRKYSTTGRKTEVDRTYHLYPHPEFVRSIIKANAVEDDIDSRKALIDEYREQGEPEADIRRVTRMPSQVVKRIRKGQSSQDDANGTGSLFDSSAD